MPNPTQDYYAWTQETIEKLRQGKWNEVNMEDLIEEIEDMGAGERNELENRLVVLLAHLLKWRYQPERRSRSWRLTIEEQRQRIARRLKKSPSLRPRLPELGEEDSYPIAVIVAARETNLEKSTFPATFEETGWTWEQVQDMEYLPD
ncbi:protein of unknown function DUF29 [Nitrosococcus halophilus Nc 4]|uniref:DUF29 domain-containing protein n=1 Tax=Nitrosococcus halophilus (strain Nc4) TaxID=472759 RepID=D5BYV3_NITHN|nr:DUF29 domain-containing protein [Nitrosococcus halophilus]ADE14166.1 protein of unknown function DUF29 [Nitrosococcus halophilus Nc 4]